MQISVTLKNGNVISLSCDSSQDSVVLGYVMNYENTSSIIVESDNADENPLDLEFIQTIDLDYHRQWSISISDNLIKEITDIYHFGSGKIAAIKHLRQTYENQHPALEGEKQPYFPLLVAKLTFEEIIDGYENHDEPFYVNWYSG